MLQTGQVVDRYIVEAPLGEGGMASVYRVRHATLGSTHALKVLHVEGRGVTERLLAEGRVQAGLDHPHALVVTDVIDVDGSPGLVMEFIDGGCLEDWVQTHPTRAERLTVFRQICEAVAAAHRSGWIHRDLKPANVLIKHTGTTVIPKVADFGLVKAVVGEQPHDGPRTREGLPMGTPGYMAPEQIENAAQVDARADVYSLGCLLIWLLTDEPAFTGSTTLELFAAVAAGDHTRLPAADPLAHVADRCLRADPAERFADAGELLAALDQPAVPPPSETIAPATIVGVSALAVVVAGALATVALGTIVAVLVAGAGTSPALEVVRSEPTCPVRDDGTIGWVRGTLPRMTAIPDPYVLDEATPVHAEMDRKTEPVCTLPAGTSIVVRRKWRRTLGEVFWLSVEEDALTAP